MKKLFLLALLVGIAISITPTRVEAVPYCGEEVIGTGCDPYGHCTDLIKKTCTDCDPTCHSTVTYFTRPANA